MISVADKLRACASGPTKCADIGINVPEDAKCVLDYAVAAFKPSSRFHSNLLQAIADAIDKEELTARHFAKRLEELADAREEIDLFGQAYVPLLLDADDVPVRVDDVMEWEDGETFRVNGIGGDTLFYVDEDGNCQWTKASDKHHHKPTTEDVLLEFFDEYDSVSGYPPDREEVLAKYAKRLQMREAE